MKLEEAAKFGAVCGLETPEEWVLNIERHSMSLFLYSEINNELKELHLDYEKYKKGEFVIDFNKIKKEEEERLEAFFAEMKSKEDKEDTFEDFFNRKFYFDENDF